MKKIILISAKAEHGKTTTADILIKKLKGKSTKIALARDLKLICKDFLGWDGKKSEKGRELLQQVGTEKIRKKLGWEDFHVNRCVETVKIIEDDFDYIIIDDARFENECDIFKANFPDKCITIRVNRLNHISILSPDQLNHISETSLDTYGFDYYINSEDGLDNLEKAIDNAFMGVLYEG